MLMVIDYCIVVLLLAMALVIIRMIKGPTSLDRVLCLDGISVCTMGILSCLLIKWGSMYYVDFILIISILGFFATIVFSNYLNISFPKQDQKTDTEEDV